MPKFIATAFLFLALIVPSGAFASVTLDTYLAFGTYDQYRYYYANFIDNEDACGSTATYYIDTMYYSGADAYFIFGEGTIDASSIQYSTRFTDMLGTLGTSSGSDWSAQRYYFTSNPGGDIGLNCDNAYIGGLYDIDLTSDESDTFTVTPSDLTQPINNEVTVNVAFDSLNNMGDYFQYHRGIDSICSDPISSVADPDSWVGLWSDDIDLAVSQSADVRVTWSDSNAVGADNCFSEILTGFWKYPDIFEMTDAYIAPIASTSTPDQTQQTTFNGFVVFGFTMWFTIWLFRKRR